MPIVLDDVLAPLIDHHAYIFAEVPVVLENLVEPQQHINFVLLFQEVLLKRLQVRNELGLALSVADARPCCQELSLVHPKTWDSAQVDQTHVKIAEA